MARPRSRNSRRKMSIEPAVKKMFFSLPLTGTKYIDISQCACIVNRRFYRQGLNWAVAGIRIHSNATTTGTVNVFKIQDTWMAANSWVKAYSLWNEMNDQVLDTQPSIKPRFHDFKIYMDPRHVTNTFANNLIPYSEDASGTQTAYLQGEWTRSLIEMANDPAPGLTEDYALMMHGDSTATVKAILQGYAASRAVPTEPDPVTQANADTGWMNNLLDMGDVHTDIALNLQEIGEDLPYDQMLYPGGGGNAVDPSLHAIANISGTTVGGTSSIEGGNFQCGLIKLVPTLADSASATAVEVEIILVAGPHRGYLAQPQQEV